MPRTRYEFVEDIGRCLVLRRKSIEAVIRIPVEEVGKGACKHNGPASDCRRCWLCGMSMGAVFVDRLFEPVRRWT